ncbi:MAG: hypothetical protein ACU4EQ_05435 [Candidatus Nitrosoglobus sp.]
MTIVEARLSSTSATIALLTLWLTWHMYRLSLPETFLSNCLADWLPLD